MSGNYKIIILKYSQRINILTISSIWINSKLISYLFSLLSKFLSINSIITTILPITASNYYKSVITKNTYKRPILSIGSISIGLIFIYFLSIFVKYLEIYFFFIIIDYYKFLVWKYSYWRIVITSWSLITHNIKFWSLFWTIWMKYLSKNSRSSALLIVTLPNHNIRIIFSNCNFWIILIIISKSINSKFCSNFKILNLLWS